ncbi:MULTISPECIES: hypothetical protein [unclassified Pseudomonas]|uniref:hypothetical protein n=1 Tax=unclassified Pseudomonas TaxID=196821 RepID=UPI00111C0778|nr:MULTISPECIES: hypothetical protein [unclassified Pseudomonas]MDI2144616.1 hypothetical protein [Pseudomonas sp. ITA]
MNPIIVNCVGVVVPADVDPLLSIAGGISDELYDGCYILATCREFLERMGSDDNLPIRERIIDRLNLPFVRIIFYCRVSSCYKIYVISMSGVSLEQDDFDVKKISSIDLDRLLNRYSSESFVRGGAQYHFATPSHNHTNAFFRLGDSIKNRDDLDRIAFWLLKSVDYSDYIFIDSWSIAALPLRALQILSKSTRFDALPAHPAKKIVDCTSVVCDVNYELKNSSRPLLLVSVVSSGTLVQKFQEIFSQAYIDKALTVVSVYSFGKQLYSLCSVECGVLNYKFDDCAFCKEGSKAVEIHPSAYYVKDLKDAGVVFTKKIADGSRAFFDRYAAYLDEIVAFHKGDELRDNKHYAYYIDYNKMSSLGVFGERLRGELSKLLTSKSVVLSFSKDEVFKGIVSDLGASYFRLDGVEDALADDVLQSVLVSDKVMVYDSVVMHGQRFERLNNLIRENYSLSSIVKNIVFFAGIYRPPLVSSETMLRNTIAYPDAEVAREFSFVETVILPDFGVQDCPWCIEVGVIGRFIKKGLRNKGRFFERLTKLSNVTDGIRGADAFFHVDSSSRHVVLGAGSYLAPEKTCISGVVLAVASGLQRMRSNEDEKKRLAPGFPYTQVLAAKNFTNYSESIIRAALVRNSSAIEFGVLEKEKTIGVLFPALGQGNQRALLSEYLIAVLCGKFPQFSILTDEVGEGLDTLINESPELMRLVYESQ